MLFLLLLFIRITLQGKKMQKTTPIYHSFFVVLSLLLSTACAQLETKATQDEVSLSSYTGAYQSKWDDTYNFFVIERDNKLYLQNTWGITEIDINDSYGFEIQAWGLSAQFSDFENGQFQNYRGTVAGQGYDYKRIKIDTDNIAFLHDKAGFFTDFSHTESANCNIDYPLHSLSENSKHPEKIELLIGQIKAQKNAWGKQNSLLIFKDNKLVVEEYFDGWTRNDPHQIQSVSKSLTSLLVGSLITEGKIADVNAPIVDYIPQYQSLLKGEKANITLANFMDMSAGIEWDEWSVPYTDPNNIRNAEMQSDDSVAFTLSLPMKHKPGKNFSYSGGYVSVVGSVVDTISKQPTVADYAKNGPLKALCFKNAYWTKQNDGKTNTAGGGTIRPMDMLKIGQLMLDNGQWSGKQLIDKKWITDSMDRNINAYNSQYGYFWWHHDAFVLEAGVAYPYVSASGWGGQEIVIIKDLNLVVVTTAENFESSGKVKNMLNKFIIPAFIE